MKTMRLILLIATASLAGFAQQWEFGGGAGAGFLPGVPLSGAVGSATAGFQTGAAFGAYVGQPLTSHISGEVRYAFMQSNLKIQSGGAQATFSGMAHVLGYDVLLHSNHKGSRTQYFAAVGGGMKIFSGTGTEAAYQALSQFAYFTKTTAVKPMVDFGAGMKYALSPHLVLRTEFRDYVTMFPKNLITPAPGTKLGGLGLLHDFVPMVTVAYEY